MATVESSPQRNASIAIFGMGNILNGYNSRVNIKDYEPKNREYGLTRKAVRAVSGLAVVGSMYDSRYYRFNFPRYEGASTLRHPRMPSDFKGIIRRVVNLPVDGKTNNRFCLQVAPLSKVANPEWEAFYMDRGWGAQYNHAFADPERAGQSIWVPLDTLGEYLTYFPNTPDESTYATRRGPVWTGVDWDALSREINLQSA